MKTFYIYNGNSEKFESVDIQNDSTSEKDIQTLKDTVNEQASKLNTLQGTVNGQGNALNTLQGTVDGQNTKLNDLQDTVDTQGDKITDLENSGVGGGGSVDNTAIRDLQSAVNTLQGTVTTQGNKITELENSGGTGGGGSSIGNTYGQYFEGKWENGEFVPDQKQVTTKCADSIVKFEGKKILFLGDSIMDFCNVPETIAKLGGMTVYNAGVGGTRAGWHNYEDYDGLSFYRIADAIESGDFSKQVACGTKLGNNKGLLHSKILAMVDFQTLDYLVISYGTNDFTGSLVVDELTEDEIAADTTGAGAFKSYKYALNYGIQKILTKYPHIKILLNTPIFRADLGTADTNFSDGYEDSKTNLKLIDFVDAMIEVGEKNHVPVNDNYRNLIINEQTYQHYLQYSAGDYVHPNKTVGAELYASRIYAQMLANW